MHTVLNTIFNASRAASQDGHLKQNPYPAGTLRYIAYELGRAEQATVTLFTSPSEDYAVGITDQGQFESIVIGDLPWRTVTTEHPTLESAVACLRDLAIDSNARNYLPTAA